ncbi:hypothetical protein ACWIUA_06615 [Ursidibacter sp. B-7004-1]
MKLTRRKKKNNRKLKDVSLISKEENASNNTLFNISAETFDKFIILIYIITLLISFRYIRYNYSFEIGWLHFFWFISLLVLFSIYFLIFNKIPFISWKEDFKIPMSILYAIVGTGLCFDQITAIQTIYTEYFGEFQPAYDAKVVNKYKRRYKSSDKYYFKLISDRHYVEEIRVSKDRYNNYYINDKITLKRKVSSQGYYIVIPSK